MDRAEANSRLSELAAEIRERFNEAKRLTQAHSLTFDLTLETERDGTTYTTHVELDRYGGVDSWTSSAWNDSGCSIDWDSSEC